MKRKLFKAFLILSVIAACGFIATVIYYTYFWERSYEVPFEAAFFGQSDLLEKWLSDGGDPNASLEGWPLLCVAVGSPKCNSRTVEILLRHGADPNGIVKGTGSNGIVNGVEISAFILAASNSFSIDIENLLLLAASGANIDCRNSRGKTPVELIANMNDAYKHRTLAEKAFEQVRAAAAQYQESRGSASHMKKAGE